MKRSALTARHASVLLSATVLLSTTVLLTTLVPPGGAAEHERPADLTLEPATRAQVIEGVISRFRQTYVFPDVAKAMEESIRARMRKGAYDRIVSASALAESLTAHLRAISHDTHATVHFSPTPLPPMDEEPHAETAQERGRRRIGSAWINHGFLKVERLRGNVGLLDLDSFADPALGGETAQAAMSLLANCDALIFDLRYCPGGNSRMVALLCSYLFDGTPVHLVDIYSRSEDSSVQSWTYPHLGGGRLAGKDVYILTSKRTHSAAEEFTYNLQNLKRATVIGEVTRGGAHPTGRYRITEHFGAAVPESRAVSPITKTNWEGVGVKPDMDVPAADALKVAHLTALERLLKSDPQSERAGQIAEVIEALKREPGSAAK